MTRTIIEKCLACHRQLPRYSLFIVCCFFVPVSLLTACADPDLVCNDALGCVRIGTNDPIRLAAMLALSGDGIYLGQDSLRGVEIALAERDNLLLGHALHLVKLDTACSIEAGRLAAIEADADPLLIGVIGDTCSAVTEAIMPAINRAGLVMISPSSTQPDLPQADFSSENEWQMSFFRTIPHSLRQATVGAEYAVNEGVKTAAIIYDNTERSAALQQTFADRFTALGGKVTFLGQVTIGQTDIQEIITAVDTDPSLELLYLPLFEPEANLVINSLTNRQKLRLLGTDSLFLPGFAQSTGTVVQGMAVTSPAVTGTAYQAFLAQWLVLYGEDPVVPYHAYAYDATTLLLNAIEAVAQEGRNGSLMIGRQALRQAVAETPLDGLTGRLLCQMAECASPAAIGVYELTMNQISGQNWPPPLLWVPSDGAQQ